jgi:hypothetical protein
MKGYLSSLAMNGPIFAARSPTNPSTFLCYAYK